MKNKYIILLASIVCLATSCNSFLDTETDNRAALDTPEKIQKLLVSAYPTTSHALLAELYSDNTDEVEPQTNYLIQQEETYRWTDMFTIHNDGTKNLWGSCYMAIAVANTALEASEPFKDQPAVVAMRAEALMCRAYGHFVLVNMFCNAYGATSATDIGIPYADKRETTVKPDYKRGTVAEVYERINADIEAALPHINNSIYKIPSYHFNQRAAYAFAARFNLYYRKYDQVIKYADELLGKGLSAKSSLRDWPATNIAPTNWVQANNFIATDNPATLLVQSTTSAWPAMHYGGYGTGARYTHNEYLSATETFKANGPWGVFNTSTGMYPQLYVSTNSKVTFVKMGYLFEMSDPIAQTGYSKMVYPAFTTDETLLCRAEAYIMQNDYAAAMDDINTFVTSFSRYGAKSLADINTFFNGIAYYTPTVPTLKKKLNPDFTIAAGDQENLIHTVLYLRRMLTMHEGLRWFDVKRYGIEIHRRKVLGNKTEVTDTMPLNDLRRAMQLPESVTSAGLPANPRK